MQTQCNRQTFLSALRGVVCADGDDSTRGTGGTKTANTQVGTLRWKLMKIGARGGCSVRRIVLSLAGGYFISGDFCRNRSQGIIPVPRINISNPSELRVIPNF
jgi:hypothetical protein